MEQKETTSYVKIMVVIEKKWKHFHINMELNLSHKS